MHVADTEIGCIARSNPYDETIHYVFKVIGLWRRFYGLSSS